MSPAGIATASVPSATSDRALVEFVRAGDDGAFEELYRRYEERIGSFVGRIVRDESRAEDVTQEAFLSALRRLRATDAEIAFKPWIYEIARNAAIDSYRRSGRAQEVSIDADDSLRPSDRRRLVGSAAPDSALISSERLDNLRGALDELSETHHRVIVMRELEGLSYREIGDRLELTRAAVESTLFRARRRLEREYEELDTGRRCQAMMVLTARVAGGTASAREVKRLGRHARWCVSCRRGAREVGVDPIRLGARLRRVAALLPWPAFLRRRGSEAASGAIANSGGPAGTLIAGPGAQLTAAVSERAAALITAAALAGAGSAVLAGIGPLGYHHSPRGGAPDRPQVQRPSPARMKVSDPQKWAGHRGDPSRIAPAARRKPAAPRGVQPTRFGPTPTGPPRPAQPGAGASAELPPVVQLDVGPPDDSGSPGSGPGKGPLDRVGVPRVDLQFPSPSSLDVEGLGLPGLRLPRVSAVVALPAGSAKPAN
jgi:RNA polymerase sigma factor (sigma-70 family)